MSPSRNGKWNKLGPLSRAQGAEQVLQELGNHVEEGRAPRDGFGAAESLRARAALQFVMMFCGDEK